MMKLSTSFIALALAAGASARTFTVVNNCGYTVWPAIFTDPNGGSSTPDQPTGWEQAAGKSVSFSVPDDWKSGRLWARTECDFSTKQDATSCVTGGCNGGLVCDKSTGTGVPPATLTEFNFDGDNDWYDVSNVDGSNVPVAITNSVNCPTPSCKTDLNANCPSELQLKDSSGKVAGCYSACSSPNVDQDPTNSPNCCSGSYDTPDTCPNSNVKDYSYFKDNCKDAYAYAYDESSESSLWTCQSSLKADYTITYCPS